MQLLLPLPLAWHGLAPVGVPTALTAPPCSWPAGTGTPTTQEQGWNPVVALVSKAD